MRRSVFAFALLGILGPLAHAGELSFVQVNQQGKSGVTGITKAYRLAISPDGKHVYATGQADHALVTFGRDAATGALTWLGDLQDGVNGVTGISVPDGTIVSPDGKYVYVVDYPGPLSVFSRDPSTGALAYLGQQKHGAAGVVGLAGDCTALAMSPDGTSLYVTDQNTISAFARDAATGAISVVQEIDSAPISFGAFGGNARLVVSPDGENLYAIGSFYSVLTVFARDPATGKLTFVEAFQNGHGGLTDMDEPYDIAASPDGESIYVVGGFQPGTLTTFARAAGTGTLTYQQTFQQGVGGVDGISTPLAVVVSNDGARVFVVGAFSQAIGSFARDPNGTLTFLDVFKDPGFNLGLYGVRDALVSPDGANLYTAAFDVDSVSVFHVAGGAPIPTTTTTVDATTSTTITTSTTVAPTTSTTLAGCPATPIAGCKVSIADGPFALRFHDDRSPAKDRMDWTWRKGTAITRAELGDPTSTTSYRLCVYENATQQPTLVLAAMAPAGGTCKQGACWKVLARKGARYRDHAGSSDGLVTVAIRPGPSMRASIVVQAKGTNLQMPPLPLLEPVTVQLHSSAGVCWETSNGTD
jgi:6-phosphogluconolactonase (cycloisomerase 2 family)